MPKRINSDPLKTITLVLSLFAVLTLPASADVHQWNLESTDDYRFESEKVEVSGGAASLKKKAPFQDASQADFDLGNYGDHTRFTESRLELGVRQIQQDHGFYSAFPQSAKTPGMISLWHLDEPSGTNVIDTVSSNVAKTSETEIVSGQNGFHYARLFDGVRSYAFIPQYENYKLSGAFSVEAWIRPIMPVKGKAQTIISRWQTVGSQKSFAVQIAADGKIDFKVSTDGATTIHHYGETVLTSGKWYHVAAVFTGQDLRVFVNGILDSPPQPMSEPVYQVNAPMYLGALIENKMDEFYEGVIDEVVLYSRALTETETLKHYGNGEALAGYWNLNEKAGIFQDASGYGHNATGRENPEYGFEGKNDTAVRFDGKTQYVETPVSSKLGPQGAYTAEMWIQPDQLPSKEEIYTLLSSYGSDSYFSVSLIEGGRVRVQSSSLNPQQVTSHGSVMPKVWQHIAVTWSAKEVRIYINGASDTQAVCNGIFSAAPAGLRFGIHSEKTAGFPGAMDEISVYRRTKSAYEIQSEGLQHYHQGTYISGTKDAGATAPWQNVEWKSEGRYGVETASDAKGLIHLYHLNEGEQTSLQDAKGESKLSLMGTHIVPGIFGGARWFSQTGYDKLVSQQPMPALSTFTVSMWFQFSSSRAGQADRIFSIGDENPSVYRSGPEGKLFVVSAGARELVSRSGIQDTAWHHLALSSDGTALFLYIDGQKNGSTPFVRPTSEDPFVLGSLKSSDSFQGAIDEAALYNFALSQDEIYAQYLSGQAEAKMLVRSSEQDNFSNQPWQGPSGPNAVEKTPSPLTAGIWHFNEISADSTLAEVSDASPAMNAGTVYGRPASLESGVLGRALYLNGSTDFILIPNAENLNPRESFTLSAWIKPASIEEFGSRVIDKNFQGGAPVFSSYSLELASRNRLALRVGYAGGYRTVTTDQDGEIAAGRWNHIAAVFTGKEIRLYINGKLRKAEPFKEQISYDSGALYMGRYGSASAEYFQGGLDEVSVDQTALTDREIAALFSQADPDNYYRPYETQKLNVASGRYFQYLVRYETKMPSITPDITAVSVHGHDYSGEIPSVINNTSVSFADLMAFRDRPGPGHQGAITYQLSNDGANWFYHNGRRWVIASSATESNTSAQVSARIQDFPKDAGIGSFYFRAFLHSPTGTEPASLDGVEIDFMPNKITVTSPNGGEAWLAGSDQTIRWNSARELTKVRVEYSKDNFKKDFHVIAQEIDNTGAYSWTVPDDVSASVRIRVMDTAQTKIYDLSDFQFRIIGAFEILSPNFKERWEVGTKQSISWRTLGTVKEVKLDYSTDNFNEKIYPIADAVKNDGRYEWIIPDMISSTAKVRITDVRDAQTFDSSNDDFSIVGKIDVASPQVSARLVVGSTEEIRWNSTGTIGAVKIEYASSRNEFNEPEWKVLEDQTTNLGVYRWKVPDSISTEAMIRVSAADDPKVSSQSMPFSIIGQVKVIHPQGGEYWVAGTKRKIAWDSVGTIPSVQIQYAVLDAETQDVFESGKPLPKTLEWNTIENSVTNIGSYVWSVPDEIQNAVIVRVSDSRDPFVSSVQSHALNVLPGVYLKVPNGGESWMVGTDQNLEWETVGDVRAVKIEYSDDQFQKDAHTIISEASNVGAFLWTIPDDLGQSVWIRVSDADQPKALDLSDQPFRIFGNLNLKRPMMGDQFEVSTLASIEWDTVGTIPFVKLEYSHDDFNKDVRLIAEKAPNTGKYSWNIPDDIGMGYQIRISDAGDLQTAVVSENKFSVVGRFYLTYPKGGENLIAGTLQRVAWKGAGSIPFIRLDYSEDGFKKSYTTIAEAAPNTGTFEWQVPNRVGQTFKLRIWDPSQPDTMFVMPAEGRIIAGFTLESPNGGEVLYVGEPVSITWKTSGLMDRVKLEYSDDNFQSRIFEIADTIENTGSYKWLVPVVGAGLYRVRVSDPRDITAYDISNSDFRIRSRSALLSPAGGEGWKIGEVQEIKWQTSGTIPKVKIEYSVDDFQSSATVVDAWENTGRFSWTIPDHVSQNVKVKISDVQDLGSFTVSESPFRIQGRIEILSPEKKGQIWRVGQNYPIVWKTSGKIPAVRISFSRDGFVSDAEVLAESVANTGSYDWTIPDRISERAQIRVSDLADLEVRSDSPEFQIAGSFQVLAPNGGETWHALERREINWVTVGTVPEVDLAFCEVSAQDPDKCFKTDDDLFVIDRGILNTGRYSWDIPRMTGAQFRLRVCDSRFPNICDESDKTFALKPQFQILSPNARALWPVGSDQEIRWQNFAASQRVGVYYASLKSTEDLKKNEGMVWKTLGEGILNEGRFLFRVPDDISNVVIFKVADWDDEALFDLSDEPVAFSASFKLLSPNGSEKWAAGSSQTISWSTTGTLSNVALEYSTDNFIHEIYLIESAYSNTGSYKWVVPPSLSQTVKVRITDQKNAAVFDTSDEFFKVMPGFIVLSPDGGEVCTVAAKEKVQWKTIGEAPKVKLEYRIGKGDWKTIAENIDNTGSYEWLLPDAASKEAQLRVSDQMDADAADVTDSAFEIRPAMIVTQPNSKMHYTVGVPAEVKWASIGTVGKVHLEYSKDGFKTDIHRIAENIDDKFNYTWTPSDDVTEAALMRVISANDSNIFDISDIPFSIVPRIEVLSPKGDESWTVSKTELIQWDWRGTLDRVNLEYSSNGFASSTVIASNIPNTGKYEWKIPDHRGGNYQIKISDSLHPQALAVSAGTFKIIPGYKMLSPNGGEFWSVGETQKISWETYGDSRTVLLEISLAKKDGVREWKPIHSTLQNTGSFDWMIPADVSSEAFLRVRDSEDAAALDATDAPFKILGKFIIQSPKKEEALIVGGKGEIRWATFGNVPSVKLEFGISEDGGDPKYQIIESFWANSGAYFWTVPDTIAELAFIRISDAQEDASAGVSEVFAIRGQLEGRVIEPNLNWTVGSEHSINWSTTGSIPAVHLYYQLPGQNDWTLMAENLANSGSFKWTIPDRTARDVSIKIEDARNANVFDVLNEKINVAPGFEITSLRAGEPLSVGSKKLIEWKTIGKSEHVWIEYSAGQGWIAAAGPIVNTNRFEWTVPDTIAKGVRVRVRDSQNENALAQSELFEIQGVIKLQTPKVSDVWTVGSKRDLIWETTGTIPQVKVEYVLVNAENALNSKQVLIQDKLENKGRLEWLVPDEISDQIKVRVSDARDASVFDETGGVFSIVGDFRFVSPKGDEVWTVASSQELVWETSGTVPAVVLEYSVDQFKQDIQTISANQPNSGKLTWIVPDSISKSVSIRISDVRDYRAHAVTNAPIKIRGALALDTKDKNSVWTVDSLQKVKWTTTGSISHVRIEFSRDDFQKDIFVVENSVRNLNQYEWKVPDGISDSGKIRISDAADPSVFSVSPFFKIRGSIEILAPKAEQPLAVLSSIPIQWKTIGSVPKVRLEYSRDGFNKDIKVIAAGVENQGSFNWQIPDDIGSGLYLRILDEVYPDTQAVSAAALQIRGGFAMIETEKTRQWTVGSVQNVRWNTIGAIPQVRLEYSKDDLFSAPVLIAENLINRGNFDWTIPDDIASSVRLRVSDMRDASAQAVSDLPIKIMGALQLKAPAAGDIEEVGSPVLIQWDTIGSIPAVRLEYAVTQKQVAGKPAQDWRLITASADNQGSYEWLIPGLIADRVMIRVSDLRDPSVSSVLEQGMTVIGALELSEPRGGERWIVSAPHAVNWNSFGDIPEVNLLMSRDGFKEDIQVIESRIKNNGTYSWTVPDMISDKVQLKVEDSRDPRAFSMSRPLTIAGDFPVFDPQGEDVWTVGSSQYLSWQTLGTIPAVRLEFSMPTLPGQPRQFLPIQESVPNTGKYEWMVPDRIASGIQFRISDSGDARVHALSSKEIKIAGDFEFKNIEEGSVWTVGQKKKILWRTFGTVEKINLEFSTDRFQQEIFSIQKNIANTGEFLWETPDKIGEDVILKITSAEDSAVLDLSSAFSIRGQLQFLPLSGDKILSVGDKRLVEWKTTGTIPIVRLEYSSDDFKSDVRVIEQNLKNIGRYEWTVPDSIAASLKIRVVDVRNPQVSSILDTPFSIQGRLRLVFPQGGEIFQVASAQNIAWQSFGTVPQVRLEYSNDGFMRNIVVIEENLPNRGAYSWVVPDSISKNVTLRISDASNPQAADQSGFFSIQGILKFLSLETNMSWRAGDQVLVGWETKGTIPQVRLEYSSDSFQGDLHTIFESIPNHGSVEWKIPADLGGTMQLRISDVRDSSVNAVTHGTAEVYGVLEITQPKQEASYQVSEPVLIQWLKKGTVAKVSLDYSSDGFQEDVHPIEALINAELGRYEWKAADVISDHVQIRVRDAEVEKVFSVSEPFRIHAGMELLQPLGDETFKVGSPESIVWKNIGSIPHVRIEISKDQFKQDIRSIDPSVFGGRDETQTYQWEIPDYIAGQTWLRVVDLRDEKVFCMTSKPFKIIGDLKLLSPFGGEPVTVGEVREIRWKTLGTIPNVRLEYSRDHFNADIRVIAESVKNEGYFDWNLPNLESEKIWVRVIDAAQPEVMASHEDGLKVKGVLQLSEPQVPAAWKIGTAQDIRWETRGHIEEVRLEYFTSDSSGAATGGIIEEKLSNTGAYTWKIPANLPSSVRLRIVSTTDPSIYSEFQNPVQIRGVLKLTYPNQPQTWVVGESKQIAWDSLGIINQVHLEYSTDGFKKHSGMIASYAPNTGRYEWKVPDLAGQSMEIRILDASNQTVTDQTLDPIQILGNVLLESPRGGERWEVGSRQDILWTAAASISRVDIEVSADRFQKHRERIATGNPNTGRFEWEIPSSFSGDLWMAVSDSAHPAARAMNDSPIRVLGKISLKNPRGGEIWNVSDQVKIEWDSLGNIPKVRIEYSTDNFMTSSPASEALENKGEFLWRIPDLITDSMHIRVSDSSDSAVASQTSSAIKVQGQLQMAGPVDGEFWITGSSKVITWNTKGSVPYVNLEYSTDNFASTMPLILGLANQGSYTWSVPDLNADQLRFRVSNSLDQSIFSLSGPVKLGGMIELIAPVGGESFQAGEDFEIRWKTSGRIPQVRIESSSDQFKQHVVTLVSSLPNEGRWLWKVPSSSAPALWVRVLDVRNPEIFDMTRAPAKITGKINLESPKGGEVWKVDQLIPIRWKSEGDMPYVRLEYSEDEFKTMMPIAAQITNGGFYEWKVPDLVGRDLKIRISDAQDIEVFDTMPYSSRVEGVLKLIQPMGGETLRASDRQLISWSTIGSIPNVDIEFSQDDFVTTVSIAKGMANQGSFVWTVPAVKTYDLKLRVFDSTNPKVQDVIHSGIAVAGQLSLSHPLGGEILFSGTELPIRWTSEGRIDQVRIEYSYDHFKTSLPVVNSVPNTGIYTWQLPEDTAKDVKVRISDVLNPTVQDAMKSGFELRPVLELLGPAEGETLAAGNRQPITWQTIGQVPQVRIEYSQDDFQKDIHTVEQVISNKGIYYWDIPGDLSGAAKIRISDVKNPKVTAQSRAPFNVAGRMALIFPRGHETFQVGERVELLWKTSPNVDHIRIEYSQDEFESAQIISAAAPNTGRFTWNVPDVIGKNNKIRIADAQNASVFSLTPLPFEVIPALEIRQPEKGAVWNVGSGQSVEWTTRGTVPHVHLQYSGDDFKTYQIIASHIPNTGKYEWQVGDVEWPLIQIRVMDPVSGIESKTVNPIQILGQIVLVSPIGGERWIAQEEAVIRWRSEGHTSQVTLEYSKDNFQSDVHLIASNVPNLGNYFWTVPTDASDNVRVRISSQGDRKVAAISPKPFKIDFYEIRWNVKDATTGKDLSGLILTDSSGETQTQLASPAVVKRPYGIYTTSWTKPGYKEFKSSWVADNDKSFMIQMTPDGLSAEQPRVNFEYDAAKDVMKIQAWYEKDSKPQPAVIGAEVRIYEGARLVQAVSSMNPDSKGFFHMIWDTRTVPGNSRYLASASITLANGKVTATPMSFQLNLPVKQSPDRNPSYEIPTPPMKARSQSKSPLAQAPAEEPVQIKKEPVKVENDSEKVSAVSYAAIAAPSAPILGKIIAPETGIINETITVQYQGSADAEPLLDLYDSNRKLIIRSQPMRAESEPGLFSYLISLRGLAFVAGREIVVSVIERKSGHFTSQPILLKSVQSAAGLHRQVGARELGDLLQQLQNSLSRLREVRSQGDIRALIQKINEELVQFADLSLESSLPPPVVEKLNQMAEELAIMVQEKGYDAAFLTADALPRNATSIQVADKLRQMQTAIAMLDRLYYYSRSGAGA